MMPRRLSWSSTSRAFKTTRNSVWGHMHEMSQGQGQPWKIHQCKPTLHHGQVNTMVYLTLRVVRVTSLHSTAQLFPQHVCSECVHWHPRPPLPMGGLLCKEVSVQTSCGNCAGIIFLLPPSRRIKALQELTWDYNYDAGSVEGKNIQCLCGAPNCRGRLL